MNKLNLLFLSKIDREKIKINLIASSVAFKERNNIDVLDAAVEKNQPINMRLFFRNRLCYYRSIANKFKKNK